MKKYLSILLILLGGSAVHAGGLSTRHQSSLQLTVEPARTISTRVGNSYSISGTNVNTTHTPSGENASAVVGGVGILTYSDKGVGSVGSVAVTQSQGCSTTNNTTTCSGGSFSFAQSFTQGDAIDGTSTTWGDITTYTLKEVLELVCQALSTTLILLHFHKEQLVIQILVLVTH